MGGKKALLVIASRNFRDEELFDTQAELEKSGVQCVIASTSLSEAVGMLGGKARPALTIDKINAEDFDALVFVGGSGSETFFKNRFALGLCQKFANAGKVTAAICIAPMVLLNAGVLKGKKATISKGISEEFKEKGANYSGNPVEVDGLIFTAQGPKDAKEFGKRIAAFLK